jgi:hypothetical protein
MSYDPPSIPEALNFLGSSVGEIAESLKALNIKGRAYYPPFCVLAQYLKKLGYSNAMVGAKHVYLGRNNPVYQLPDHVYEFRNRFDQGFYPYLLED